jgi:hypothetical protein
MAFVLILEPRALCSGGFRIRASTDADIGRVELFFNVCDVFICDVIGTVYMLCIGAIVKAGVYLSRVSNFVTPGISFTECVGNSTNRGSAASITHRLRLRRNRGHISRTVDGGLFGHHTSC